MQLVGLNTQVAFQATKAEKKTEANAAVNTSTAPMANDSFEKPEQKKTFKERLGGIAKFFVNFKEMAVGIAKGQVAFQATKAEKKTEANAAVNTSTAPMANDSFEKPEQKKTFKERLGGIAKFFVNFKEMAVGIAKGLLYGGAAAGVIVLGDRAINLKHTMKGGMAASIVGGGIAAFHIIKARLKSNQRTANVDHQLKIGHRDK